MQFLYKILSYFAKPNFIKYDQWFDEDLEKNKVDVNNKKIKSISKVYNFFTNNRITKLLPLKITCN